MAKLISGRRSHLVTALIPYYGGDSDAAPSNKDNRFGYLEQTVKSLQKLCSEVIVGVNNSGDAKIVSKLRVTVKELISEPRYIPANLFLWAQAELLDSVKYVYVTEADQVLHYHFNFDTLNDTDYLVPHRIEQLGDKGQGKDRGVVITFNKKQWIIANGIPVGDGLYHPAHITDQYGGAFLCSRELFNKVPFRETPGMPVEYATGLDAASVGNALKTSKWENFFVEHLSGKEYHDKL